MADSTSVRESIGTGIDGLIDGVIECFADEEVSRLWLDEDERNAMPVFQFGSVLLPVQGFRLSRDPF